jgi:hypothetical protein
MFLEFVYYNAIRFKVVPSESDTRLETVLPLLEALLEAFCCHVLQCVGCGSLDVVERLEIISS